jgi:hypothetical protein
MVVRLRPARAVDIVKFARFAVPLQYVGVAAEQDGKVIGVGVIMWGAGDRAWVTLDTTPELRKMPGLLHRVGLALVNAGSQACDELYSLHAGKEPTSERWLTRLGFRDTGELLGKERIFKWHP